MSERIEQAVIAQQREKIAAGVELEDAINHEVTAEAALKEAQAATTKARRAALSAGWDEKSLRKLGLLGGRNSIKAKAKSNNSAESSPETAEPNY